jgi:hypothetical protein
MIAGGGGWKLGRRGEVLNSKKQEVREMATREA